MRKLLLALAFVSILAACGRSTTAPAPEQLPSNFTAWAQIDPANIAAPDGVSYAMGEANGMAVAEIGGVPDDATSTGSTGGVSVRLPDAFEAQASGKQVRVTVRAFSAHEGAQLGVAYSTSEVGNSGWQQFPLTAIPTDYAFVYDVPAMKVGNGDYVGFRDYGGASVQIAAFSTEVVAVARP